jgi:hypothetical protein
MFGRTRILLTIWACVFSVPVAAQAPAPTTTQFDGTYNGISLTFEEAGRDEPGCRDAACLPGPDH